MSRQKTKKWDIGAFLARTGCMIELALLGIVPAPRLVPIFSLYIFPGHLLIDYLLNGLARACLLNLCRLPDLKPRVGNETAKRLLEVGLSLPMLLPGSSRARSRVSYPDTVLMFVAMLPAGSGAAEIVDFQVFFGNGK